MATAIIEEEYREDRNQYGPIVVTDQGATWRAELSNKKKQYGGTIAFRIDKCTGAIDNLEFGE